MMQDFYKSLSSLFPYNTVEATRTLLVQGGSGTSSITPHTYLGFALFFSSCMGLLAFFVSPIATPEPLMQVGLAFAAFLFTAALFYLLIVSNAENRAREVESVLPEALQIISSNIRAGMTLENAVWGAARPEFGVLRDEIKRVSAEAFGGAPMVRALGKMPARVRSAATARAVKLVLEGIALGGSMSALLDEVAKDVRNARLLQKEIETTTMMYAMFIVFAAVIASPLLFSVATYYSEMNENALKQRGGSIDEGVLKQSGMAGLPGIGGKTGSSFSPSDVKLFALAGIAITTFFAGLILGVIRKGSWLTGLKYSPILMIIALAIFLTSLSFLQTAFSSLLK